MYDEVDQVVDLDFQKQVLASLSSVYVSMHLIDLEKNTFKTIKPAAFIQPLLNEEEDASVQIKKVARKLIAEDYILPALKFFDIFTVEERLSVRSPVRHEFLAKDGHWCRGSFIPAGRDENGSLKAVVLAITRIDEEKKNQIDSEERLKQALKDQSEMYNEMLQNQSAGVIAYNLKTKQIQMMNAAALSIFGWDCVGNSKIDYILEKMQSPKKDAIIQRINSLTLMDDEISYEFAIKRDESNYIFVLGHTKVVLLSNQDEIVICSFTNITKIKKMERELVLISQTDGLTKINNRASGEKRIERCLKDGQAGMFCLFDVDKFKSINDNYGHGCGDAVLVEIAKALKRSFRDNDIVMRLGGDEFAVFAQGVVDKNVGELCLQRFYNNINKINIAELGDRKVTVSLGAVFCQEKLDADGNVVRDATGHSFVEETFDGLYQKADIEMYKCKKQQGNSFSFFGSDT